MKYASNPTVVDASQFINGEHHPHVCYDGMGHYVLGKQGKVAVQSTDWIIAEPDGSGHYPCADAIFRAKYRLIDAPASVGEPGLTLAETTARVEANSNANRVSIPSIQARIAQVDYQHNEGTTLTLCTITMRNGFVFIGHSACADPANYDAEVGERYAYENAFKQIWSHEAYLIRERLAGLA